jgi:hypothetical protein
LEEKVKGLKKDFLFAAVRGEEEVYLFSRPGVVVVALLPWNNSPPTILVLCTLAPFALTCLAVTPSLRSRKTYEAIRLTHPRMKTTTPEEMTIRQKGRPRVDCVTEGLLRLPRMVMPRMICVRARKTKPERGERRGQFVEK